MREETLRMEHVTYKEQGVTQLENFSMSIRTGEILGLLPINRYGVSTMMRLLKQNLPLYYGYIYYREKLVNQWRYSDYGINRISIIQKRSSLIEGMTVADNVFILRPGFKKHLIPTKVLKQQLQLFLEDLKVDIKADAYIENLTSFERFVVELLKAVVAGNYLVVLDDISSFISDAELQKLHQIIRYYARKGMTFLYIVPHFEEARQICDRMVIMKNGQIIKSFSSTSQVADMQMYRWTEGFNRRVSEQIAQKVNTITSKEPVFEMEGIVYDGVKELNFLVAPGECLILQDLNNCILSDLVEILSGKKRIKQGRILIDGEVFKQKSDRRIAVIQEVPAESMLFPNMSYLDNLCFTMDHRFKDVWRRKAIKNSLRQEYSDLLGENVFDLSVDDLTQEQKYDLVYTRILVQNPKVVFCAQPFRRAGVSVRIHVWELLERFLKKGIAVVILAVNLADSLALADRLIRIGKNQTMQEYDREDFGNLPIDAPWVYLYQENENTKDD